MSLEVNYSNIPDGVKKQGGFVGAIPAENYKNGLIDKNPKNCRTGGNAQADNPKTWVQFEDALAKVRDGTYMALGWEMGLEPAGLVTIDLDHCINEKGILDPRARAIVSAANSYTEVSQSGHGLHIILEGKQPGDRHKKGCVEMYENVHYIILTGNIYMDHKEISANQKLIDAVYDHYLSDTKQGEIMTFFKEKKNAAGSGEKVEKSGGAQKKDRETTELMSPVRDLVTVETVASTSKAKNYITDALSTNDIVGIFSKGRGKNGKKLQSMFAGKWEDAGYSDQSAADQAFCNALAFYTRKNAAQMDEVFRTSGLMRPKWDEKHSGSGKTYGEMTIEKAISGCKVEYGERSEFPVVDADDKPLKSAWENIAYLLKCWKLRVRYNVLTRKIEINGKPVDDLDIIATKLWGKCNKAGLGVNLSDVRAHLPVVAAEDAYNPWAEYLNRCWGSWDRQSRLDQMADGFILDNRVPQNKTMVKLFLTKFLVQACQLAFNSYGRTRPQVVLVLTGAGNIGKTGFAEYVMREVPDLLLIGASIEPDRKDSVMRATEFALVEMGELPRSLKAKDSLKAFLTSGSDTLRKPYGHGNQTFPRLTSYIATTNDLEILLDDYGAGDRRYLCIALERFNWDVIDNICPGQLWGEAMKLAFEDKVPYWLSPGECKAINKHNLHFKKQSSYELAIMDRLDWKTNSQSWKQVTATSLCEGLGFNVGEASQVARALNNMVKSGQIAPPLHSGRTAVYNLPPALRYYEAPLVDKEISRIS